jgi:Ca-activated chloride channel family protein
VSVPDLFLRPGALWLVPGALLAALVFLLLDRRRRSRLREIAGERASRLAGSLSPGRRRLRRVLFATGLALAALAAGGPVLGGGGPALRPGSLDLVVCLDVSRSMLARDLAPSRLEAAKAAIRELASRAAGNRMGLVLFAGEARLAVPLTRDLDSLAEMAGRAGVLSVPTGGTDLAAALRAADAALTRGSEGAGAVLLLTDGDDLAGRGLEAAALLRDRGVPVHAVGLGSPRGALIPVPGPGGETYLTDREGREVLAARDDESLAAIADRTGGAYTGVDSGAIPIARVYDGEILPAAADASHASNRRERMDGYQWPLLAAFLLWILDTGISERRR